MLDLTICVPTGKARQAAMECFSRMSPRQWVEMTHLAAEVVALQEQVATGRVYLVAPVSAEHLAAVVKSSG